MPQPPSNDLSVFATAILTAIPWPLVLFDRDRRIVAANRSALEAFPPLERSEQDDANLPPASADLAGSAATSIPIPPPDAFASTVATTSVHRYRRPGAEESQVEITTTPIIDERGSVVRVLAAYRDLTESRRVALDLRRELDFLDAVLATAGALVVVLDTFGRIVRFNHACESTTGYTAEEVLGKPFWQIFLLEEEVEGVKRIFGDLREGHFPNEHENYWIAKDATLKLIAWSNAALLSEDGSVEYIIATGIDVTERRRAEARLRELTQNLERRVAERTAMVEHRATQLRALASELVQVEHRERARLAKILHDRHQQILVAAKYGIEELADRTEAAAIREELRRIESIVEQAVEESRSLTSELCPSVLFGSGLTTAIEWLAHSMSEKHDLVVAVDVDPDADSVTESVKVFVFDAVRELLFNVVKHAKTRQARVRITAEPTDLLRVVVSDEGVGFAPPEATQRSSGGFGLLSMRERLDAIGGTLAIRSAQGRGTRATLLVPISRPAAGTDVDSLESDPPTDSTSRIRVVLADDHEIVRKGLRSRIQKEPDLEVIGEAGDGEVALALARDLRPDVVIMDISMPRMSGLEATRRITKELPDVRVVGLSVHRITEMGEAMKLAGADRFLSKDAPIESILAAVRGEPDSEAGDTTGPG